MLGIGEGEVFNPFGDYELGRIAEQPMREDQEEARRLEGGRKTASKSPRAMWMTALFAITALAMLYFLFSGL